MKGNKKTSTVTKYTELNLVTDFSSVSSAGWTIVDLLQIAGGTGEQDRIGPSVKIGGIHLSGTLVGGQVNGIADDPYNSVRIIVVRASESLVSADWNAVALNDPSLRNAFPKVRQFVYDKTFVISSYGPDTTGYMVKAIPVHFELPINSLFSWETIASSTHINESLFIAIRSDSGAVPNPGFVTPAKVWLDFRNIN